LRLSAAGKLVLLLVVGSLGACGGGDADGKTQAELCVEPTPVADASALGDLPIERWGTITLVETKRGFVGARAISEIQIVELFPEMVRDLGDEGYSYLGGENEGFEAELAFSTPQKNFVSFALRETDCKEQILIRVLVEKGPSEASGNGKGGNG
jgi:hypothetical protein